MTKRQFLVDSVSDLSCYLRWLLQDRRQATNYDLSVTNNSTIEPFGTFHLKLNLGLRRSFPWSFIVTDTSTLIIDSDFIAYYHLLPDCRIKRLIDDVTDLAVGDKVSSVSQCSIKSVATLPLFRGISGHHTFRRIASAIKHQTVHHILTSPGQPIACRPRRLLQVD